MSNLPSYKMFIGGDWVAAQSGEWFETFRPLCRSTLGLGCAWIQG